MQTDTNQIHVLEIESAANSTVDNYSDTLNIDLQQQLAEAKTFNFIELQPTEKNNLRIAPKLREFASTDWFIALIFTSVLIVAFIRIFFSRYILTALEALFNNNLAEKIFENKNTLQIRSFTLLNFWFYVNISLFITELYFFENMTNNNLFPIWLFFSILCVSIFLIINFKYLLLFITGRVFKTTEVLEEFHYYFLLIAKNIALFLFPIIIILPFTPPTLRAFLIYIGYGILFLFPLLIIYKGFNIFIKKRLSFFYTFLYLCTFEIIPVLLIYKLTERYLINFG
jgi:hypothetical protein